MTEVNQKGFVFKTGNTEASGGILAVRIAVGLPIAVVTAFVGNMVNGIVVPSPIAGDELAFLARMVVIGLFTAAGGMIAWFNLFDSRRGALLVWSIAAVGGVLGAIIAYYIGDRYIDHPDVYILNQRLSQAILLGAGIGANASAALLAIAASRMGR